jgi:uncharacterized membrane protein
MVDPDLFNDVPLFQLLDADERKMLADQVSVRQFKEDEVIFRAGDPGGLAYGSWGFVITFAAILIVDVTINSRLANPWDPYPFILLNLFLSMLAAIQAPVIMVSQNRQDAKDRVRSELDYRVNLKADLEIEEVLQRVGRLEEMLAEHAHAIETEE